MDYFILFYANISKNKNNTIKVEVKSMSCKIINNSIYATSLLTTTTTTSLCISTVFESESILITHALTSS